MVEVPQTVDKEKVEKQIAEFRPNPAYATALVPKGFDEAMRVATTLAKSGVVPNGLAGRPEACFVAIAFGMELGLPPMQAIQNIMVVNNRPAIWGDAALALALGSGILKDFDEDAPDQALTQKFGRCRVTLTNGRVVERKFSIEDAQRAKLWTKEGPWQNYPGRMLQMRARSWALRDADPRVLKGMMVREEIEDVEGADVFSPPVQMPKAKEQPRIVQDAQIVPEGGLTPTPPPNPPPAQPHAQEPASSAKQPPAEMQNDAQEPANDPDLRITEARRKDIFKMRCEAKVKVEVAKAWLKERGHQDTATLTNKEADEFETWIVKNAAA